MSLELIGTLGTVTTTIIVATTAIAALVQLRHLREGNQINALLAIQREFDSPEYRNAVLLARHDLKNALEDRAFCAYCVAVDKGLPTTHDPAHERLRQAAVLMGNTFENVGVLVKKRIFDRSIFLEMYSGMTDGIWDRLEGFVALTRAGNYPAPIYENFEYITALSRRYLALEPISYPSDVPRLELQLPRAAEGML